MKIRTIGQLQDILDKELGWRIKEIADLYSAIRTSTASWQSTIIRAGVPILYAHWEGFIKNASEAYINFVSCKKLRLDQLSDNFVVLGAKKHLHNITTSKKTKLNIEVVNFFRTQMTARADIKLSSAINTESNLSSGVFENIAIAIGLDYAKYETRYNLIDISLLQRRNNIAHGEYLELDKTSYKSLSDDVLSLLRAYKTDIESLASTNVFLYR